MTDWLFAVLLGVIEGVTEFLPVSSTGHLPTAERLAGRPCQAPFHTVIQVGPVPAVGGAFADSVPRLTPRRQDPAHQGNLLNTAGRSCASGKRGVGQT